MRNYSIQPAATKYQNPSIVVMGPVMRMLAVLCWLVALPSIAVAADVENCLATACIATPQSSVPTAPQVHDTDAEGWSAHPRAGVPTLAFTESSLDFGTVDTGSSGPLIQAVLVNSSVSVPATNLNFTSDPEFPLMHNFGSCQGLEVLPPQGSCLVRIKFAPVSPGPAIGTLMAASDEGAGATMSLSGTGGSDVVLYSQFHDWGTAPNFFIMLATTYLGTPEFSSGTADDFTVQDPAGWTVRKVGFEVGQRDSQSTGPLSIDIHFLPDDGGTPGNTPVCSAPDSSVVLWEAPRDESRAEIVLSTPCTLPPGHYWLQVVMTMNDYFLPDSWFGLGLQFVMKPDEPPPIHLNPPVWRQPGGGNGYPGCFEWTPLSPPNCGLEDQDFMTVYGEVFWLVGQVTTDPIFTNGFETD